MMNVEFISTNDPLVTESTFDPLQENQPSTTKTTLIKTQGSELPKIVKVESNYKDKNETIEYDFNMLEHCGIVNDEYNSDASISDISENDANDMGGISSSSSSISFTEFSDSCPTEHIEECRNQKCAAQKLRLLSQLTELETKLQQYNENIQECSKICAKKELHLMKLKDTLDKNKFKSIDKTPALKKPTILFSSFSKEFTNEELLQFRLIGDIKSNDSTFVLKVVKSLYKNDFDKIATISISGRSRKGENKEKMSPTIIQIIEDMLEERLKSFNLKKSEFHLRRSQLKKHIKNAIGNIGKANDDSKKKSNKTFNVD